MKKIIKKLTSIFNKKQKCGIEVNTMIKFDYDSMPIEYHQEYLKRFPKDEIYVFLGELIQMTGHCIICNYKTGMIICGYHTEDFIPLTDKEI